MNALAADLLLWARGPGLTISIAIFLLGLVLRLIEIYALGRSRKCLARPNREGVAPGVETVFRRFTVPDGMFHRAPVTYLGGIVFHVGFFIALFLFAPHIELFKEVLGLSWPALPNPMVDIMAGVALIAMAVVLVSRITDPVKRFLSGFEDYLVWALTFLPLLTGYLAIHHLILPYTLMLALHLLSAELLLIALPFTKLMHTFTAFSSRFITGVWFGRKGVAS